MDELLKFVKARIARIEQQKPNNPMDGIENIGRRYELKIIESFIEDGPEATEQILHIINDAKKEIE